MTTLLTTELSELDKKHFIHPTSSIAQQQAEGPSHIFTEGKGVYLTDSNGHKVIDGMSSLWNVNIGHGVKEMAEAAYEQMTKLAFTSNFSTFSNEPAIRLAEKLSKILPGDLNAVFFTSGGSESNDTAFKLARHYWILKGQPERQKIISRKMSYHGVAMGATSATGLKPFRDFTNANAPHFHYVNSSVEEFRTLIEEEGPETIAAFITEIVQGAGGVNLPPEGYFKEIRKICDEYGILMIIDEVITGFGRTGKYFAIEHDAIQPDMLCFAKGVTSGYAQLGGVALNDRLHNDFKTLSKGTLLHGYTYSGHPVACNVALKNIEIIERDGLIENAEKMGEVLYKGLKYLEGKHEIVTNARGFGLLGGIDIVKDSQSGERFDEYVSPLIVKEAAKLGLILRTVTYDHDSIVFSPPLIINEAEVEQMINILDQAIVNIKGEVLRG
ncbi:aminotransferase family protein [Cytobacillus sp. FSL K6-0265]|uniref:aminotransferase family protein n=1 Tax=Cytobacillus sp. FSL K6-0265 TaxID=2921448 RepID=UPI0030F70012